MYAIASRQGSDAAHWTEVPDIRLESANSVLCRTLELGICGTDREIIASRSPFLPAGESHIVLGHECLAEVVEAGAGVSDLQVGDLVAPLVRRQIEPEIASAGEADGRAPAPAKTPTALTAAVRVDLLSWGDYVERGIVYAHGFSTPYWVDQPRHLVAIPRRLAKVAVLTEPQSVAEKAFREATTLQSARLECDWAALRPRVLVLGLGPIGFAAALAGLGRGWPVTMMGRDDEQTFRAELAQRFGAAYKQISPASWESTFDASDAPYDLLLECTGSESLLSDASNLLAPRGAAVWLAGSRQPQPTCSALPQMMRMGVIRNHLHLGSVNAAPCDFQAALERLERFRTSTPAELAALITKRVSPSESLPDFVTREPQGVKVVVDYR